MNRHVNRWIPVLCRFIPVSALVDITERYVSSCQSYLVICIDWDGAEDSYGIVTRRAQKIKRFLKTIHQETWKRNSVDVMIYALGDKNEIVTEKEHRYCPVKECIHVTNQHDYGWKKWLPKLNPKVKGLRNRGV